LTHRVQIDGDLECALKLGLMFGQFLQQSRYCPNEQTVSA
jgi:hypothetical protein